MNQDQLEIQSEMRQALRKELLKVCCPQELDQFHEWIEQETSYQMYWNGSWINTATNSLLTTQVLYDMFRMDFPGSELMSEAEKKCYLMFEKMKCDNLWTVAIKKVYEKPNVWRFRKLICELKSQAADNPAVMKNILGENLLKAIIKL